MEPHTTEHGESVCTYFLASISRCRLLSQDRELCFSQLRVKKARSRQQIQNDNIYSQNNYAFFRYFQKHPPIMNI